LKVTAFAGMADRGVARSPYDRLRAYLTV